MPGESRPPFEPGNTSGALSRGGRPRKTQDVRDAEEWGKTGGRPLEVIKQLFTDATGAEKASERTAAAHEYLDRIVGKAIAAVEVSGPDGEPLIDWSRLTDEQLRALVTIGRAATSGAGDDSSGGGGTPAT